MLKKIGIVLVIALAVAVFCLAALVWALKYLERRADTLYQIKANVASSVLNQHFHIDSAKQDIIQAENLSLVGIEKHLYYRAHKEKSVTLERFEHTSADGGIRKSYYFTTAGRLWTVKFFFGSRSSTQYNALLALLDTRLSDVLVAMDNALLLWEIRQPHRTIRMAARPTDAHFPDEQTSGNVLVIGLDDD
jgi:Na+-translocating ferredoxin:NAD+ oxidoreductase RnfG subunit